MVFFNHQLVGSFMSDNINVQSDTVHIQSCESCQGKNLLKFVVGGSNPVGVDNICIHNDN